MSWHKLSVAAAAMIDIYPAADPIAMSLVGLSLDERRGFLRQWFNEGIPYAFKTAPLGFEKIRDWLAGRLQVHPTDIFLIGSAKLGISMSPGAKFGQPFDPSTSDYDFGVANEALFDILSKDAHMWLEDYRTGRVEPNTNQAREYWPENAQNVPRNLYRGFVDYYKIPNFPRYANIQLIAQTVFRLGYELEKSALPRAKKISLRVYKTWDAVMNQQMINLDTTIESLRLKFKAKQLERSA